MIFKKLGGFRYGPYKQRNFCVAGTHQSDVPQKMEHLDLHTACRTGPPPPGRFIGCLRESHSNTGNRIPAQLYCLDSLR